MSNRPIELSLEQQFHLRSFEAQVANMSHEQAQEFLLVLYEQMMMRENTYKKLLKHQWGIVMDGFVSPSQEGEQ